MLMCMESELCSGLLQCSCYTENGRYSVLTLCRNCAVYEQMPCLYGMLDFML